MRNRGWSVVAIALLAGLLLAAWGGGLRAQSAKNTSTDAGPGGPGVNVGEPCTVYLRGDATGAVIHDRVPDLSLLVQRHGIFEGMDERWIILRDSNRRYEIPVASVALIEYGGKGEKKSSGSHKPETDDGHPRLDLR